MSPAEGAAAHTQTVPEIPARRLRQRPPGRQPGPDPERERVQERLAGDRARRAGTRTGEVGAFAYRSPGPSFEDRSQPRPRRAAPAVRRGVRLNGVWCSGLLLVGVGVVLILTGALGWQPGVRETVALVLVGVAVALLAGRGGVFEAAVLPGTVVIVVGALIVAADPGGLGGAVGGLGTFSRIWQVIGLLAPAAAATWVCALVTLALRRAGLLRPF